MQQEPDTTKHESQIKEQRISELQENLQTELKELISLADHVEQQKKEVESIMDSLVEAGTQHSLLESLFESIYESKLESENPSMTQWMKKLGFREPKKGI